MEKLKTKSPIEEVGIPKTIKGVEKSPSKTDPAETARIARDGIKTEKSIIDIQKDEKHITEAQDRIREMKEPEVQTERQEGINDGESVDAEGENLNLLKNEAEIRLSNNLGWDENFIKNKKAELNAMTPGQLYNEIQELSTEGMLNFIKTRKEAGASDLVKKLENTLMNIRRVKDDKNTTRTFNSLMTSANEPNSGLTMESLNRVLKNSGYKGKVLGIFGKNDCFDSFQNDITDTLLIQEHKDIFEKIKKKVGKYSGNSTSRSALAEGVYQSKSEYGDGYPVINIKEKDL